MVNSICQLNYVLMVRLFLKYIHENIIDKHMQYYSDYLNILFNKYFN